MISESFGILERSTFGCEHRLAGTVIGRMCRGERLVRVTHARSRNSRLGRVDDDLGDATALGEAEIHLGSVRREVRL